MASLEGRIRRLEGLLGASIEEDPEQIAVWARIWASMRCHKEHDGDCPHPMSVDGLHPSGECPIEEVDRDWARSTLRDFREAGLEPTISGFVHLAHQIKKRRLRAGHNDASMSGSATPG